MNFIDCLSKNSTNSLSVLQFGQLIKLKDKKLIKDKLSNYIFYNNIEDISLYSKLFQEDIFNNNDELELLEIEKKCNSNMCSSNKISTSKSFCVLNDDNNSSSSFLNNSFDSLKNKLVIEKQLKFNYCKKVVYNYYKLFDKNKIENKFVKNIKNPFKSMIICNCCKK